MVVAFSPWAVGIKTSILTSSLLMRCPNPNPTWYLIFILAHSFLDRRINSEHVHGRGFHNGAEREVPAHEGNTDLNEIGKNYQTSI